MNVYMVRYFLHNPKYFYTEQVSIISAILKWLVVEGMDQAWINGSMDHHGSKAVWVAWVGMGYPFSFSIIYTEPQQKVCMNESKLSIWPQTLD